jgi:hypothetical protein
VHSDISYIALTVPLRCCASTSASTCSMCSTQIQAIVKQKTPRHVRFNLLEEVVVRKHRWQWATRQSGHGWRRCRAAAPSGARTLHSQLCCRCARGRCDWSCTRAAATAARGAPSRVLTSPWPPSSPRAAQRVRSVGVAAAFTCSVLQESGYAHSRH